LTEKAYELWQDAPWELLSDHHILSIELNQWDVGTLYVSVMGMLGMEYGVLLYRSLDSLKRFRASVLARRVI
jgi:calcineurin-like phosphoesterase